MNAPSEQPFESWGFSYSIIISPLVKARRANPPFKRRRNYLSEVDDLRCGSASGLCRPRRG